MPNPVCDLLNAVEYERSFLEQVYRLTASTKPPDIDIQLIYGADGKPRRNVFASGCFDLSDWRAGFLSVGGPLIFITAFKILDSMVDWLVKTPLKAAPIQIDQKLAALKDLFPDNLPELFRSEAELFERFIALYRRTSDLRNTLIHRDDFELSTAGLHIKPGRSGAATERVAVGHSDLALFAEVGPTLLRLLAGISTFDVRDRKHVRWLFDKLVSLHQQPLLGQAQVQVGRVTLSFPELPSVPIDLSRIREDIAPGIPLKDGQGTFASREYDVVFDVHITIGDGIAGAIEEYLIPHIDVDKHPSNIACIDLLEYKLHSGRQVDLNN